MKLYIISKQNMTFSECQNKIYKKVIIFYEIYLKFVMVDVFLCRLPESAKISIIEACTGLNSRKISAEETKKIIKCCYYDTEVDL